MALAKRFALAWLPVVVAFALGMYFSNTVDAHTEDSTLLHAGHSDTMDGTLTAKGFSYSPRRNATLVVGASEFVPIVETCEYQRGAIFGGESPGVLQDLNSCSYVAPVDLPPGARMKRVVWFYDTSVAGSDATLDLWRITRSGGHALVANLDAELNCSSPCTAEDDTIDDPVVDSDIDYALRFRAPKVTNEGARLLKVLIRYSVAKPGTL